MGREIALVTPELMKWAREKAKLTLEEASARIKRPSKEIEMWESGALKPTIAQARKASEVYRRPLAVFFLANPPEDFETLRDFRRLPGTKERDYSPELTELIRITQSKQKWIKEFLNSEDSPVLDFFGTANLKSNTFELAKEIRNKTGISYQEQIDFSSRQDALKEWIKRIEDLGVFVFRQREISLKEIRGFIISDKIAPFLFINSKDSKSGQIFTLIHELVHLWIGQSGISNLESEGNFTNNESGEIETFCNLVASEVLLDNQTFLKIWGFENNILNIEEKIENISNSYKISEECIARKLLFNQIISNQEYLKLRNNFQIRWIEYEESERIKQRNSKGGPSYYVISASRNGYAFTQTILSGYSSGAILGRDASSLLNIKINNLYQLGKTIGLYKNNYAGG